MSIENEVIDFRSLYLILRKHQRYVLYCVSGFLLLALTYVLTATPLYTAETAIFLDQGKAEIVSDASSAQQSNFDSSRIDSQIEIIKSRSIALLVLDELKPQEYLTAVESNDLNAQDRIVKETMSGLKVTRKSETHVIEIRYSAKDPVLASDYANAYARSYIFDQIDSLKGTSSTAAEWLKTRIVELREESRNAYNIVQAFRNEHNLFSANGNLINEDQLKEMNDQLGLARTNTATAKAKYEYSQSVIKNNDINAAVAEAFDNDVINNIRSEYLSSKKRLSELKRLLGPDHETVKNQNQEIQEYEEIVLNEMERIAQSQLSAYKVAVARERALETGLKKLINIKVENESLLSELRDLELEAEAHNAMYQNYIEKFQQLSQRKSLPISESRVISQATPPQEKSHPKIVLILGASIIMGFGVGALCALYLNFVDKSIRTGSQVQALGIRFIGFFPELSFPTASRQMRNSSKNEYYFSEPDKMFALDNPLSVHAETIRTARAYIDRKVAKNGGGTVIGTVSCCPHEGKSTIAINLALTIAKTSKCLLIDADLRNPSFSKKEFQHELVGIGHVLKKEVKPEEAFIHEAKTGLSILSAECTDIEATLDEMKHNSLGTLVQYYAQQFDYIIIDMPPLNAASDAYCLSPFIDKYLVVAEWGSRIGEELVSAMEVNEIEPEKIIGVILNKADLKQLVKFHGYEIYADRGYFSHSSLLPN